MLLVDVAHRVQFMDELVIYPTHLFGKVRVIVSLHFDLGGAICRLPLVIRTK